jgi:hypothetical protein
VNRSVKNNRAAIFVTEATEHARLVSACPILGIDSDNGSEFINAHLFDYCVEHKIAFTRSRLGKRTAGRSRAEGLDPRPRARRLLAS